MSGFQQVVVTDDEKAQYRAIPQFNVSIAKLTVMSIVTFGIYELYWCYKQWDAQRRRDNSDISPFWRAVFAPLWGFSLFPKLQELTTKFGTPATWSPTGLAVAFLLLGACWRLPDPYSLVSTLSFLPLLVAQRSINALNAAAAPEADRNDTYSGRNIIVIVIGAILFLLAVVGTIFPSPDAAETVRQVAT